MFVSEIFDECAEILGSTDTKKVFRKIQQAVQTLMESGHWTHTTAEVDVCTGWDRCSLALPRGIDVPLAVNIDGSPTYFRNRLFQYHVNKGGMYNSVEWAWDDRGYVATLMDIIQPSQLVAVAESNNDVGKKLRVLGTDQNNRILRSQMPNGAGVDGLLIPIHSQQDFQYGTIAPDDATIATRDVAIDPITDFTTTTPHGLTSGQGMSARVLTGTIPVPLNDGQTYYVGVIDAVTVQLFSDSLNAQALQYPIALSSIVGFGTMQLRDQRNAQVVTSLEFASAPSFAIDSPNEVVFPTLPLPAPLEQKKTYFAQPIDSTHLNIFSSLSDAKSNSNPIYTTGSMSPIDIDIRKAIVPETKLVFSVRHYFSDGDQVQAFTAGGVLPQPLIANQNYFVNIIDDYSVSLHENQADAAASTPTNFVNPIKITTAGSGTNSLVKLIQATSRVGTESQITAQGLSIATPSGSGAQFQANVVGVVTSTRIVSGGSGYGTAVPGVTFSAPTDLPAGSNLQAKPAVGYAILVSGSVSNIVITDPGAGYSSAPTITIDPPVSGLQATATATITTSFVSGFTKISGGFNYTDAPQVEITGGGGTGATATATVNNTNLSVLSISSVGTAASAVTASPHGFSSGQKIRISGANQSNYNGDFTIIVPQINTPILSITKAVAGATLATVTTNAVDHNYNTGDRVTISGCTLASSGYNGPYNVTVTGPQTFTINVLSTLPTSVTGTVISSIADDTATTFTYTLLTTYTGSNNNAGITVFSGEVIGINIVTAGTGYTTTPTVTITPSTGVFVNFSSTGALPSPLVSGTAYRAETPLNGITGTFTVKNTDFSDVNITSAGTGTFYVVLSRAFGVDFTNNWLGDFTTLATGQQIYFGTDFILPTTSPAIDNSVTPFFLNVVSNTLSRAYTSVSSANGGLTTSTILLSGLTSGGTTTATATTTTPHYLSAGQSVTIFGASIAGYNGTFTILTASTNSFTYAVVSGLAVPTGSITATTGLINIDSFGTGQTYYAIRTQVSPSVDSNLIKPVNTAFLTEDEVVRFSTSGTLPLPLVVGTDYTIKIIGDSIRAYSGITPVVLTSTGSGQLSLDIIRDVQVQPSNNIVADSSLYETGTMLVARAKEGDTLPTGLLPNTNYYVRRIDNNSFELYDTLANARNLTSTTGRRTYTTTGNSVSSTFFVDAISDPIFVKSVAHIEKPITDGYVSLYAWDYGRSNDMTLIGQYHPTEINPQYRRIRIGKPCAWARIIYKVTNPSITSVYDYIPLEQERAIIAAVHAVDLEDKDFADQAMRYWQIAFGYLKNQQESIDGHAMAVPQINSICYAEGDGADPVMF
jgi:hypothetical protein